MPVVPFAQVGFLFSLLILIVASSTRCVNAAQPSRRRYVSSSSTSYDRLISTFSPEGRLEQVEYSAQAATRTILATIDREENKIIVVAAIGSRLQPIFNDYSDTASTCSFQAWMIGTGIAGDVLWLRDFLRERALERAIILDDTTTPIDTLAKDAETICHKRTFIAGVRPFGAAFFLFGFLDGIPEIAKVSGWSGATTRLDFACLGPHQDALHTFLQQQRRKVDSTQSAVDTLLDAAKHVLGIKTKFDVWILSADGETRQYINVHDRASRRRLQECLLLHQKTIESDQAQK